MSTTPEGRPATPVDMSRKCPVQGCNQAVDLLLESSDGFLIGAHRCYMGRFSDGFPSAESVTVTSLEEVVPLAETKIVLNLLLHFMHPQSPPTLSEIDFETLLSLGYAAEKYQVFSAMLLCHLRFSEVRHCESHPSEILYYAVRHRYIDLVDQVAPYALKMKLADIERSCNDDWRFFKAWAIYRERYVDTTSLQAQYFKALMALARPCPWGGCSGTGAIAEQCPWPTTSSALERALDECICYNCRENIVPARYALVNLVDQQASASSPEPFSSVYTF
ncbi:hypothetical protein C8J56DRAFT_1171469 [Mycena floridula]|nr:hypothetical protein C8J56DRAFT_1171469 [Mycena floridula]